MLPVIPAASSVKPSTKAQLDILLENIEVSILFVSYTERTVRDKLNSIIYYYLKKLDINLILIRHAGKCLHTYFTS